MFANVIFPAYGAAYVTPVLIFPLAAVVLVIEGWMLSHFNPEASRKAIVLSTLGMNVASYLIGVLIAPMLLIDPGLEPYQVSGGTQVVDRGREWNRLAADSFVQAAIVSILVEAVVLLPFRGRAKFDHIFKPVATGNCIGYAILLGAFKLSQ